MEDVIDIGPDEVAKREFDAKKRERELLEQDAEIAVFMSELHGKGYQLGISRLSPSWCQGYLDTWPLDDPISLSEIRDAYGGKRFQLRILGPDGRYIVARTVRIDGDPLRNGIPVTPADVRRETAEANMIPMPQQPEGGGLAGEMLQLLITQMNGQNEFFRSMAAEKMQAVDPLSTMQQTAQMISMMKDMAGEISGDDGMSGIAKIFMEEMVAKRSNGNNAEPPALPPRRRRRRRPAPPQQQASVAAPQQQPAPPAPQQNPEPDPEPDPELSEELADLGPEEAAEVIGETFARWNPDEQRAAIAAILGDDEMMQSLQEDQNDGDEESDEESDEEGEQESEG